MRKYSPMTPGGVVNVSCLEIAGRAESVVGAQVRWLGLPFCLLSTCCLIGMALGSEIGDIAPDEVIVSLDTMPRR
jgi:hypothetical protein